MGLLWDGKTFAELYPDHMPAHLRKQFEAEQLLIDVEEWVQTLRDIQALPTADIDPWITEPGEFL